MSKEYDQVKTISFTSALCRLVAIAAPDFAGTFTKQANWWVASSVLFAATQALISALE